MVKFDKSNQKEESSSLLPLAGSFFKVHPDLKEHYFAVNEFKYSKNEEWFICNAMNHFSIILSVGSKQFEALAKLIVHCEEQGTALICVYDKTTKSGVVFGEDEECAVTWEHNDSWFARYHLNSVNQYSTLPPTPTPQDDGVASAKRTRAARPK